MTLAPQRGVTASTAASSARTAGRLPGPRGDRRPALAALAVLLILGGALVSGLVAYRSGQRADFLVLARDVAPGQRITEQDLDVARIAGEGARAIPASQRSQVVNQFATVGGFERALLTPEMVTPTLAVPPGAVVVGVALDTGQAPAAGLRIGDVVRVISVPERGANDDPEILVEAARVTAVGGGGEQAGGSGVPSGGGGGVVVSVVVPASAAAQVATASSQRSAVLVQLPAGTPATADR